MIAVVIAMIIISYILSKKHAKATTTVIVSPITEVKEAMNKLAKGNLQVSVKPSSILELCELSTATTKTINTLTGYIQNITTVLGQLEDRDMTVTVDIDYMGDFVPIKNSLIEITQYLNELIVNIKDSANQVASGANKFLIAHSQLLKAHKIKTIPSQHLLNKLMISQQLYKTMPKKLGM